MSTRRLLFLTASTRQSGHEGNTEWLARQAAAFLPAAVQQHWLRLADYPLPPFEDKRHTTGSYPPPEGHAHTLLQATLACTDLVLVSPVYWFSIPAPLKLYLDHWSGWMRTPGVAFKDEMARKRLYLICTNGDRAKAQPMVDSVQLCAQFLGMDWRGLLWGKGGPPGTAAQDQAAVAAAAPFLAL